MTEASKPLVVVIGFLGCPQATLQKYIDLHVARSHAVVSYQPSAISILVPSIALSRTQKVASAISSHIEERPRPIIFHVLSNNGAYHLGAMLNILESEHGNSTDTALLTSMNSQHADTHKSITKYTNDKDIKGNRKVINNIAGVVFDSGPSEPSLSMIVRGFTSFLTSTLPFFGKTPREEHPFITPIVKPAMEALVNFTKRSDIVQWALSGVHHSIPPSAHQMYLCSDADTLIPVKDITEFAQNQILRHEKWDSHFSSLSSSSPSTSSTPSPSPSSSVSPIECSHLLSDRISMHNFQTSMHVHHLRVHRSTYELLIEQFIRKALIDFDKRKQM